MNKKTIGFIFLSLLAVFLLLLAFLLYRNNNLLSSDGTYVEGVKVEGIVVRMTIEEDDTKYVYETEELQEGSTLTDLILLYNGENQPIIHVRSNQSNDYISRVEYFPDIVDGSWLVIVDDEEYIGHYSQLLLHDGITITITPK